LVKTISSLGKDTTVEEKNPVANPLIVLREEFDDWAILFDPDTGDAFGLNPTGVLVWKLLDGAHSLEDMVEQLRQDIQDIPDEAVEHVASFVEDLTKRGLAGYEIEPIQG